jgi:predicted anti-sigma-YlaC factor YlaD
MNELNCEDVFIAAMAWDDGYPTTLSLVEIESHLENCPTCRREITELRMLSSLLNNQRRKWPSEKMWTAVEQRLQRGPQTVQLFVLLGVLLVAFKLIELLPQHDMGQLFKLVPALFTAAIFVYLKQNPFKVNPNLKL